MSSDSELEDLPAEIRRAAEEAEDNCLPQLSRQSYEAVYTNFNSWKRVKRIMSTNETVLLAYFGELAKNLAPSSLWSKWSMLKTMIHRRERKDINKYLRLKRFLKEKSNGFVARKAKTFTDVDVRKFLVEAPDFDYLAAKVALIMGITGACRREELRDMCLSHLRFEENHVVVTIPKTKTKIIRTFIVNSPLKEIVEKYIQTRPNGLPHDNLFLSYRQGRCQKQIIGINRIGQMPNKIACWLGLDETELYTGHSFRRTSATLLANAGASMTVLKRHGGWRSTSTAEGYIADSISNKRKICNQITNNIVEEETPCDAAPKKTYKRIKIMADSDDGASPLTSTSTRVTTSAQTHASAQASTSARGHASAQASASTQASNSAQASTSAQASASAGPSRLPQPSTPIQPPTLEELLRSTKPTVTVECCLM